MLEPIDEALIPDHFRIKPRHSWPSGAFVLFFLISAAANILTTAFGAAFFQGVHADNSEIVWIWFGAGVLSTAIGWWLGRRYRQAIHWAMGGLIAWAFGGFLCLFWVLFGRWLP